MRKTRYFCNICDVEVSDKNLYKLLLGGAYNFINIKTNVQQKNIFVDDICPGCTQKIIDTLKLQVKVQT